MLQNRATAEVVMRPTLRTWNRYQLLWQGVYQDLYRIVTTAWVEYGTGAKPAEGVKPSVNMSNPLEAGMDQMTALLDSFWANGIVPKKTLSEVALAMPALGLSTDDIERIILEMYPEETDAMEPKEVQEMFAAVMNATLPDDTIAELWANMQAASKMVPHD